MAVEFVHVDVEPGPAHAEGVSLRWKRAEGGGDRVVRQVQYESEQGLAGAWRVSGTDDADGLRTRDARAVLVEDSSDGEAWLVVGGAHGLVLEHVETGARLREAYLLLSKRIAL